MNGFVAPAPVSWTVRSLPLQEKFFEQNVRPLLAENCYSCHGPKKQKGRLRLDSIEAILKGGESGPALVPGKPDESLLVSAINYAGPEMPPKGKLPREKVAVLTRWVSSGARWPAGDRLDHASIQSVATSRGGMTAAGRGSGRCKAFASARRRLILCPHDAISSDWVQNPIDAFVLKGLRDHELTPAPRRAGYP